MFSSAARTIVSRAAASASRGAAVNRLSVTPSMMAARFGSVSFIIILFVQYNFSNFEEEQLQIITWLSSLMALVLIGRVESLK